jgi:DNA-binding transcriptional regulator YdaS (Cro superfamily)
LADPVRNIIAAARMVYGEHWQSQLALSVGLSQSMLSLIASGERPLTPATQAAIVKAIRGDVDLKSKQMSRAIQLLDGIQS